MYPISVIKKAKELRSRGFTFAEIKKTSGFIPQSTLSYWFKDIKTPSFYDEKIKKINEISRKKAYKVNKERRQNERAEFLELIIKENKNLLNRFENDKIFKKLALIMLYLGEGSRWKSHRGLMLGSSDPNIISLYIKLLEDVYSIPRSLMRARILYRADQDLRKLTSYWSKIIKFPKEHFYKTKFDPRTLGRPTKNKEYKGVCVITCAGTRIQLELEIIAKMLCGGR